MSQWLSGLRRIGLHLSLLTLAIAWLGLLPAQSAAGDKLQKEPPKATTVDLGGGVKMEFVLIQKGTFKMGSPKTEKDRDGDLDKFDREEQHDVEITRPFYLAKYPVTQEQYVAITSKKNPSAFSKGGIGADRLKDLDTKHFPVDSVSWNDAKACCADMTKIDKQKRKFRLPTEAEWEYACRAGTKSAYFFGDDPKDIGEYASFSHDPGEALLRGRTYRVGEKKPNPWGLYDMTGNMRQWCEDYFGPYEGLKREDPLRAEKHSEEKRVNRGGSWSLPVRCCRSACRRWPQVPGSSDIELGFRVAFTPD